MKTIKEYLQSGHTAKEQTKSLSEELAYSICDHINDIDITNLLNSEHPNLKEEDSTCMYFEPHKMSFDDANAIFNYFDELKDEFHVQVIKGDISKNEGLSINSEDDKIWIDIHCNPYGTHEVTEIYMCNEVAEKLLKIVKKYENN